MTDDHVLDQLPTPEELVGKDELDEDDEMALDGAALVEEGPAPTDDEPPRRQPAL